MYKGHKDLIIKFLHGDREKIHPVAMSVSGAQKHQKEKNNLKKRKDKNKRLVRNMIAPISLNDSKNEGKGKVGDWTNTFFSKWKVVCTPSGKLAIRAG